MPDAVWAVIWIRRSVSTTRLFLNVAMRIGRFQQLRERLGSANIEGWPVVGALAQPLRRSDAVPQHASSAHGRNGDKVSSRAASHALQLFSSANAIVNNVSTPGLVLLAAGNTNLRPERHRRTGRGARSRILDDRITMEFHRL